MNIVEKLSLIVMATVLTICGLYAILVMSRKHCEYWQDHQRIDNTIHHETKLSCKVFYYIQNDT